MDKLQKISKYADRIVGSMIIATFSIMIICCVLQVFTRYVLNSSLSWTEELARYTFIWANLLAASFCIKTNSHARVTVIFDALPTSIQRIFISVTQVLIMGMAGVMIVQGLKLAAMTQNQLSPAIGLHVSLVYLAIPVSGIFIIFYTVINVINAVKGIPEKEEKL
ncbi:MAG: TRAP transporter small permease [Desulfitobacteriia bacterium]|jgi:TRAP-type C4-dicarboxylate transport system permease small subunit